MTTTQTSTTTDLDNVRDALNECQAQLNATFIQREREILVSIIALLTKLNLIFVGTPGTAKTALSWAMLKHITDGSKFKIHCGAFTSENDMFGIPDLEAYKKGVNCRVTKGRLADSDFANLDEVFKTSDGAMNSTLGALNERVYEDRTIKLRTAFCATNWPEINARTQNVEAFYDRLVLRCAVREVDGEDAELAMLDAGDVEDNSYVPNTFATFTLAGLDAAYASVREVTVPEDVKRTLIRLCIRLRKEKVLTTPRRKVKCLNVLRAHAWLNDRTSVTLDDFDILKNVLWHDESQIPVVNGVVDSVDQEVVSWCIKCVDTALVAYSDIKYLDNDARMERAAAVMKTFEKAGNDILKQLTNVGATAKGRIQIGKATDEMAKKWDELNAQVTAHFNL